MSLGTICPKCGIKVSPKHRYCSSCGKGLLPGTEPWPGLVAWVLRALFGDGLDPHLVKFTNSSIAGGLALLVLSAVLSGVDYFVDRMYPGRSELLARPCWYLIGTLLAIHVLTMASHYCGYLSHGRLETIWVPWFLGLPRRAATRCTSVARSIGTRMSAGRRRKKGSSVPTRVDEQSAVPNLRHSSVNDVPAMLRRNTDADNRDQQAQQFLGKPPEERNQ